MKKRIILVGPSCSGKTHLKDRFIAKGYKPDVSYTSRKPRVGETQGEDYHFVTPWKFEDMIAEEMFYEWVKYEDNYYGTGLREWDECDIFIMESDGIASLGEHRDECFVIYLNPERIVRENRMRTQRHWSQRKVKERAKQDFIKFSGFTDYDLKVSDPDF